MFRLALFFIAAAYFMHAANDPKNIARVTDGAASMAAKVGAAATGAAMDALKQTVGNAVAQAQTQALAPGGVLATVKQYSGANGSVDQISGGEDRSWRSTHGDPCPRGGPDAAGNLHYCY